MLRQWWIVSFLALCSVLGSSAQATTGKPAQIRDSQIRLYVEKGVVRLSKQGFVIVAKGGMVKARALRSDANGFYVTLQDVYCEKGQPEYWRCRECKLIVRGISGIKKQRAEKGREHRFFYPVHFDGYDD